MKNHCQGVDIGPKSKEKHQNQQNKPDSSKYPCGLKLQQIHQEQVSFHSCL